VLSSGFRIRFPRPVSQLLNDIYDYLSRLRMSDSTVDPITTLSSLTASMSSLESALSSLHNRPWPETLESLTTLDRAKMDILLAYAINDLVWGIFAQFSLVRRGLMGESLFEDAGFGSGRT